MTSWVIYPKHCAEFMDQGFCIVPAKPLDKLNQVRAMLVAGLRSYITEGKGLSDKDYLNQFHEFVDRSKLNDIRVKVHKEIGASEEFKKKVFDLIKDPLFDLIGNEIVMQRQVSFVTHLPKDTTSLLYLHTDVWAGCSPYEVILWLPLVDVFDTKSMYLTPKPENLKHLRSLKQGLQLNSSIELLEKVRPNIEFLKMGFGEALLFSPTLLHGAVENLTNETRFILNVRFKSLFSPYGTKALGETFTPVNYRPSTEIGLEYENEFGILNE
jgi:sporadic carbohydrate cluster 2OG-Fe(II) oxygenase